MTSSREDLSAEDLSELIGHVYDCVIDPEGWPAALAAMCDKLFFANGALYVVDIRQGVSRIDIGVGVDPETRLKALPYAKDMADLVAALPAQFQQPGDEPAALIRHVDPKILEANRYRSEWALPQGLFDAAHLTLIRDTDRLGSVAFGRHQDFGPVGDRELRALRLLAPHIRRAVTITDLLDMRLLEKQALEATVEELSIAILLVGAGGEILHTNPRAEEMLHEGRHVQVVRGRLSSPDREQSAALLDAIAAAMQSDTAIGAAGIGLPLRSPSEPPAIAHVLPLARGQVRTRLAPRAVAAVFIATGQGPLPSLDLFIETYDLTQGEGQILGRLVAGDTLVAAAATIGISLNTAKSHLAHVFTKTGVHKQSELIALIHRLGPPLRGH